jgi:hypothetical protein
MTYTNIALIQALSGLIAAIAQLIRAIRRSP